VRCLKVDELELVNNFFSSKLTCYCLLYCNTETILVTDGRKYFPWGKIVGQPLCNILFIIRLKVSSLLTDIIVQYEQWNKVLYHYCAKFYIINIGYVKILYKIYTIQSYTTSYFISL